MNKPTQTKQRSTTSWPLEMNSILFLFGCKLRVLLSHCQWCNPTTRSTTAPLSYPAQYSPSPTLPSPPLPSSYTKDGALWGVGGSSCILSKVHALKKFFFISAFWTQARAVQMKKSYHILFAKHDPNEKI